LTNVSSLTRDHKMMRIRRAQRDVMAGNTIELDEIAPPEILDPRHVQGHHSRDLCSWNVLRTLAGLVNDDRALYAENGIAKSVTVDKRQTMRASLVMVSLRLLTWCCVILLAVLSLLPAPVLIRMGVPRRLGHFGAHDGWVSVAVAGYRLEHFVAYAGSAAIAMAGYGASRGTVQIIGGFWVYAGILEYLQHFSPGRHPSILDFAASALGALCGGLAVALLWRRLPVSTP